MNNKEFENQYLKDKLERIEEVFIINNSRKSKKKDKTSNNLCLVKINFIATIKASAI
jgi:hypothetical protein